MYIDVNGKTGYRLLQGTSGKTYGNLKLFTPEERAAALADGIQEHVAPPPAPASPDALERKRKRHIIGYAMSRVNEDLIGDAEEGEDKLLFTLLEILQAIRGTAVSLINKGLMVPADFTPAVKNLADQVALYQDIRQAAKTAIANQDDVATAQAAIDAIIPPGDQP